MIQSKNTKQYISNFFTNIQTFCNIDRDQDPLKRFKSDEGRNI